MPEIHAALACNLDANLLLASAPLFETGKVEALEWSFDTLYRHRNIPSWFNELLEYFGHARRLVGHGVYFSIFSGKWSNEQSDWLESLRRKSAHFRFDHVTEHFGFMTGRDFHNGAPLSVPMSAQTLAIGRDRLWRIQDACGCPVGLENLAFAYSLEEVKRHGEFLHQLIEPVNGFIILDLHNLFCQLHNFKVGFDDLANMFPLERVREIHISGGSWEDNPFNPDEKIRRDTHDDSVPEAVFDLLKKTIPLCPNLKYVVLEQLGTALGTEAEREQFRQDFLKMESIVKKAGDKKYTLNDFLPESQPIPPTPLEDLHLFQQQAELSGILENATGAEEAHCLLAVSSLANSAWNTEHWEPKMLETALRIAQKWKEGFGGPEDQALRFT